jgi:Na+-transporting methylmalonyl-CoA/oxaloacetate decarboxylase gamma subunit
MFGLLGFILLFVLFIVIIVLTLLGNIVRMIFGFGKRTPKQFNGHKNNANDYTNQQTNDSNNSTSGKKKIFGDDEGEYVEFEEVK